MGERMTPASSQARVPLFPIVWDTSSPPAR